MKIALKIGGSVMFPKHGPDSSYIKKLSTIVKKIRKDHDIVLCLGGGEFARNYVSSIQLDDDEKEWVMINLIKVNVQALSYVLKMDPVHTESEFGVKNSIIGGTKPGRSTDSSIATAALKINADLLIKATNVNGIYDKDPKKHEDASMIEKLSFSELKKIIPNSSPGNYGILDKSAIETICNNKIKTRIINGRDPNNILRVINGEKLGTVIGD